MRKEFLLSFCLLVASAAFALPNPKPSRNGYTLPVVEEEQQAGPTGPIGSPGTTGIGITGPTGLAGGVGPYALLYSTSQISVSEDDAFAFNATPVLAGITIVPDTDNTRFAVEQSGTYLVSYSVVFNPGEQVNPETWSIGLGEWDTDGFIEQNGTGIAVNMVETADNNDIIFHRDVVVELMNDESYGLINLGPGVVTPVLRGDGDAANWPAITLYVQWLDEYILN